MFRKKNTEVSIVSTLIESLSIKTPSLEQKIKYLSGGNQQKAIIAKWLFTESDILIFDEPTRGIDVGAKVEIYKTMNELIRRGKSIIMISSELPEIISMSHRVAVMYAGEIVSIFEKTDITQWNIMKASIGE